MPIDLEAMQTGRWTPADVWATIAELRTARARVAELEAAGTELLRYIRLCEIMQDDETRKACKAFGYDPLGAKTNPKEVS